MKSLSPSANSYSFSTASQPMLYATGVYLCLYFLCDRCWSKWTLCVQDGRVRFGNWQGRNRPTRIFGRRPVGKEGRSLEEEVALRPEVERLSIIGTE